MISQEDILAIIKRIFLKDNQVTSLDSTLDFIQSGICDSMGLVILAAELEKQFPSLRIFDQEIKRENLSSISRVLSFLKLKGLDVKE